MAANNEWKVSSTVLHIGSYGYPRRTKVRTKDGAFQIEVTRCLPTPTPYADFAGWLVEMQSCVADLADVRVSYFDGELVNAVGWRDATSEQVAILKDHDFS